MKRGEVWTIGGAKDYASKPRPAVVVQDDAFGDSESITLCPFTTDTEGGPLTRPAIEPNRANGLRQPSRLMIDKITTVSKTKMGQRIGYLEEVEINLLNQAMLTFLGLAVREVDR